MSSEAITQNDLREILSRTVGSVPSEYRKLLWTNPSPTSSFSAQTVVLDLSSYDDVEIEMAGVATSQSTTSQYFTLKVGTGGLLSISANNIWWRYVTPRTTGVEFGAGYKTTTYGSGATVDNTQMTPIAIYGIKYERVAPPQIDNTLEVASGTVDHSGFNAVTVAGASSSYKTISFGKTFSKIPQVVVQEHNNSLNNYGAIGISVSYVTTTGFNLYAHGVPQTTLSGMSYDWIAMTQIGE